MLVSFGKIEQKSLTVAVKPSATPMKPIQDYVHPDDYTQPTYEIFTSRVLAQM